METPVLLLVYNRPELTRRVFERIRAARPRRLLVVADGPRANVPGDDERSRLARRETEAVDWDAEVERDYAAENLGCKRRVSSGIDWFFSRVERGIVLEDDCVPHPSFFPFCERMLERYAEDERIFHVSGSCFLGAPRKASSAYYFSVYPTVWGWASWRRAWRHYDLSLLRYAAFRAAGGIDRRLGTRWERAFWEETLDRMARGEIDTWDHAWTFALWQSGGLAVVPRVNLVENVGSGAGGTHMRGDRRAPPAIDERGIDVEGLIGPSAMLPDTAADARTLAAFLRFFPRGARRRLAWRTLRRELGLR